MLFFGIIILLVYALGNVYVFLRGWQFVVTIFPGANKKIYLIIMILIALLYIISMIFFRDKYSKISVAVMYLGSLWMVVLLYLFMILLSLDIFRLIGHFIQPLNAILISNARNLIIFAGFGTILLVFGILICGAYLERNTRITDYDVTVSKKVSTINNLKILFVSDIHLGNIIGIDRITRIVDMVNAQSPDIVLFGGDIIEGDYGPFEIANMGNEIKRIKAKYGVYGILGNHEYFGRNVQKSIQLLRESGIKMLIDETTLIEDKFYIVGRNDKTGQGFSGNNRKSLEELMIPIDISKPVILLDHQPSNLNEAVNNGVDLQLSGHTHHGQLWPVNYITSRVYELDWGYLKKNDTNIIVSCGAGTWGPPFRIGSYSEIVKVNVKFQ